MTEFNDNPPTITITPQSLAYYIRNGYELKLYNKKQINSTAASYRILIPVVPAIGKVLKTDFNFSYGDNEWIERASEAGCVRVHITTTSDLMCEFKCTPGVLLQTQEVFSFVNSFCDMSKFFGKCRELLKQFNQEGLADDFTKICRSPMLLCGRNIHVGAILRIIDLIESETLAPARNAFLDCEDFSKEGIRKFCIESGRVLNINKGEK